MGIEQRRTHGSLSEGRWVCTDCHCKMDHRKESTGAFWTVWVILMALEVLAEMVVLLSTNPETVISTALYRGSLMTVLMLAMLIKLALPGRKLVCQYCDGHVVPSDSPMGHAILESRKPDPEPAQAPVQRDQPWGAGGM